ncbi:MAG: hypothetical protein HQL72_15470 [Magnetococcales bacterium]|nr:hypothetical protein [Magnetococcales bacterium]
MKSSDKTIPIVLLELVAGVFFLLVILVMAPLLSDRIDALSTARSPELAGPPPILSLQQAAEAEIPAIAAMNALEKKVDALLNQRREPMLTLSEPKPGEYEALIEGYLQQFAERFEALEKNMDARLSNPEDPLAIQFKLLEDKVNALVGVEGPQKSPKLDDLNRRVDFLLHENETNTLPTLGILSEKIDKLIQERSQRDTLAREQAYLEPPPAPQQPLSDPARPVLPALSAVGMTKQEPLIDIEQIPSTFDEPREKVLRSVQAVLFDHQIETSINHQTSSIQLPEFFDFSLGSSTLSSEQVDRLAGLADALADLLPCYTQSSQRLVQEKCPYGRNSVPLDFILINSYSIGGNVGTLRINYNSRLANARSVYILKTLVTARPDLLSFFNKEGNALFDAVGKLAPVGERRSRRTVIQFVMENRGG